VLAGLCEKYRTVGYPHFSRLVLRLEGPPDRATGQLGVRVRLGVGDAIRANPRGKPGSRPSKAAAERETDCLPEGGGFEPSVPREEKAYLRFGDRVG
jgi:hypothetical protein